MFANWLLVGGLGLALVVLGGGHRTVGFAFTLVGMLGAIFHFPEAKRARRIERRRHGEDV